MKVDTVSVSQLEGHPIIHAAVENNVITEAKSVGEIFRGFEVFLRGRDHLDAQ